MMSIQQLPEKSKLKSGRDKRKKILLIVQIPTGKIYMVKIVGDNLRFAGSLRCALRASVEMTIWGGGNFTFGQVWRIRNSLGA